MEQADNKSGMFGARQMRNCLPCKKRKIKCDRRIPCGPCALRRDGKSCTPAVGKMEDIVDEVDSYVSTREFKTLAQHVEALQAKVDALEHSVEGGAGPSGMKRKADTPDDEPSPHLIRSRKHLGDDEMVFALEDFQMSNRVNSLRNLADSPDVSTVLGPGNPMSFQGITSDAARFTDNHPLAFIIPQETDYIEQALNALPDQPTCQLLVQAYFDNVEWFQRCLHYPTFMGRCHQLWNNEREALTPAFICGYIMVICLGLQMGSDSLPGMANALELADHLYRVAEGVLLCSRFMSRHSFEFLQAISLMTIYGFAMEDGGDGTWTLCGTAIKIAQNLGLNRLEAEGPGKDWGEKWNSRLKREMARRVWWTFVSLDWAHAMAHGSTYAIHPSQNLTALPANLDDDQLEDPDAVPQPMSVYTPISMHILRFKFVQLYREITDYMASRHTPSYSFILSMDDSIIELANNLPKHFCDPADLPLDEDRSIVIDSIFLNITANTRLVRLHRSFFLRGYRDPRYVRSKERCVRSSHTILSLLDLAKRRAPVLLNFWIILFYAFSAAIPVCIDLLLEPTDEKRHAVRTILETFREQSATSPAARNSVFVIERLLEVEGSFSHNASKRMRLEGGSSSSGTPASQHETLKATIRSILESATFKRDSVQESVPDFTAPNQGFHPDIGRMFDPLNLTPAAVDASSTTSEPASLDAAWPAFSFDMFDTLWTTPWPTQ